MGNGITAWSYSALSGYESCPRQFKYRRIDKLPEPTSPALAKGRKVHDEAAKFLDGSTDVFPTSCVTFRDQFYELRDMNPIVELQWAFTKKWRPTGWFAKDAYCRVILDAGKVYSDGTADVIDHKTGKRYDDDYMDQLGLFAAATIKMHPEVYNVTTRLWYLDTADEVIEEFTKDQAMEILEDLEGRAARMMTDKRFPPKPSWKCRFCHFRNDNGGPCEFGAT